MIEAAPDDLAAPPRQAPRAGRLSVRAGRGRQIAPPGLVPARAIRHGRTVLADHVRDSRIREQACAVAVVSGEVAELVDVASLAAADGSRPGRIEFVRGGDQVGKETLHLGHHPPVAEERLVGQAPDDDAWMVAMDADHLAQLLLHACLELGLVRGSRGIGTGTPGTPEAGGAPEAVLRPEQHAQLIARPGKCRGMRVVGAADEVEPRVLHHPDITEEPAVGHGVSPTRMVLVHIRALEVAVFAIEEEPLVCRELEPPKAQRRGVAVHGLASV